MASEILTDMVQLIGHQRSIELLRAWGGRRLRVPLELDPDHALVFVIGADAAAEVVRVYGGSHLDMPAERNYLVDIRNDAIARAFLVDRRSISWLSEAYGVSRRHVTCILDQLGHQEERLARAAGTRT